MTEILFYHLTHHTLEGALPDLVERCLERNWNVVIQTGTEAVRDAINTHLWTWKAESFIPHAAQDSAPGNPADHPVWITTTTETPNSAQVRFVLDGAVPGSTEAFERVVYMFDGRDDEAVSGARERWKIEKAAGHDLTYWQQDEQGRWARFV